MILLAKQPKHILPEHVESHTERLFIYPNGDPETNPSPHSYAVNRVATNEIPGQKIYGQPTRYALVHGIEASWLLLHPIPDRDYHARLRYCPAAKEI